MDIVVDCANVTVRGGSRYNVEVSLDGVSKNDILDHFDANEAIEHFGQEEILDLIDVEFIKKYFDLTEITD